MKEKGDIIKLEKLSDSFESISSHSMASFEEQKME
jgi:hypothetical protein